MSSSRCQDCLFPHCIHFVVWAHCQRGTNFKLSLVRYVADGWQGGTFYLRWVNFWLNFGNVDDKTWWSSNIIVSTEPNTPLFGIANTASLQLIRIDFSARVPVIADVTCESRNASYCRRNTIRNTMGVEISSARDVMHLLDPEHLWSADYGTDYDHTRKW